MFQAGFGLFILLLGKHDGEGRNEEDGDEDESIGSHYLVEFERIQGRLNFPGMFVPGGVGGETLDQEANAVLKK